MDGPNPPRNWSAPGFPRPAADNYPGTPISAFPRFLLLTSVFWRLAPPFPRHAPFNHKSTRRNKFHFGAATRCRTPSPVHLLACSTALAKRVAVFGVAGRYFLANIRYFPFDVACRIVRSCRPVNDLRLAKLLADSSLLYVRVAVWPRFGINLHATCALLPAVADLRHSDSPLSPSLPVIAGASPTLYPRRPCPRRRINPEDLTAKVAENA
jgi:hypothetical protein